MWHDRCVQYRLDLDHRATATIEQLEQLGAAEAKRRRLALHEHQRRLEHATHMAAHAASVEGQQLARRERQRIKAAKEAAAHRDWELWAAGEAADLSVSPLGRGGRQRLRHLLKAIT